MIFILICAPLRNTQILYNKHELLWLPEETNVTLLVDGWVGRQWTDGWMDPSMPSSNDAISIDLILPLQTPQCILLVFSQKALLHLVICYGNF